MEIVALTLPAVSGPMASLTRGAADPTHTTTLITLEGGNPFADTLSVRVSGANSLTGEIETTSVGLIGPRGSMNLTQL